MATYNPPTENLSVFDSGVFHAVSGSSGLTIDQGDLRYLRFPLGQGGETLPSVSVTGTASIGGATTMSGDITLNEASGQQTITCSAPSGLNFSTTTNGAPISFTTQSSAGVNTDVLKIQSAQAPRVTMNVTDVVFQDKTSPSQQCTITISSNGTNIKSTASSGLGGVIIDSSTSTAGAGAITLKTKDGTPSTTTGLILSGTALTASTAGVSASQYLCLTINGTQYKIALLNA